MGDYQLREAVTLLWVGFGLVCDGCWLVTVCRYNCQSSALVSRAVRERIRGWMRVLDSFVVGVVVFPRLSR